MSASSSDSVEQQQQQQQHGATAAAAAQCSVWPWVKAARDIVRAEPRQEPDRLPVELLPWLYLSDMPSILSLGTTTTTTETTTTIPPYTAVLTTNKLWNDEDVWKITAYLSELDIAHGYVGGVDIIGYDMMKYHWEDARALIASWLMMEPVSALDHNNSEPPNPQRPKIIIHCAAGTNRSALIAGAAMMAFSPTNHHHGNCNNRDGDDKGLNFLEVIAILKKQRGVVLNNVWFIQQLAEFAQRQGRLGPRPFGYTEEPLRKSELVF